MDMKYVELSDAGEELKPDLVVYIEKCMIVSVTTTNCQLLGSIQKAMESKQSFTGYHVAKEKYSD